MNIRSFTLAAGVLLASTPALAVAPSWWGGEGVANQTPGKGIGIGYGLYEATMIPSTGQGSITGYFNICYVPNNYSKCINFNGEPFHLEVDTLEFTPLGDKPERRNWINTCLSDSDCQVFHPDTAPRTGDGNLKAVSFNTFPGDNQVYAKLRFNPYADYHQYSVLILPDRIEWKVDGETVLTRDRNATVGVRKLPPGYANFDQLLRNGQMKLIINVWDGSQGGDGGFGGPKTTQQTTGQEARFQRIAYYAATCDGDTCTMPSEPSFLTDFAAKKFRKDNQAWDLNSGSTVCSTGNGNRVFWELIRRNDYPVYVSPGNVSCSYDRGIYLYMTKQPIPR